MSEIDKIKEFIINLSGNKIITVMTMNGLQKFDVDSDGVIGYEESHPAIFDHWLKQAINSVGSVIVRQFTNIESHKLDDCTSIPYKNIYGFVGVDGLFKSLNEKELEHSFSFDYKTNNPIEIERGLRFCLVKKW